MGLGLSRAWPNPTNDTIAPHPLANLRFPASSVPRPWSRAMAMAAGTVASSGVYLLQFPVKMNIISSPFMSTWPSSKLGFDSLRLRATAPSRKLQVRAARTESKGVSLGFRAPHFEVFSLSFLLPHSHSLYLFLILSESLFFYPFLFLFFFFNVELVSGFSFRSLLLGKCGRWKILNRTLLYWWSPFLQFPFLSFFHFAFYMNLPFYFECHILKFVKACGFCLDDGKTLVWNRFERKFASYGWVIIVKAEMKFGRLRYFHGLRMYKHRRGNEIGFVVMEVIWG